MSWADDVIARDRARGKLGRKPTSRIGRYAASFGRGALETVQGVGDVVSTAFGSRGLGMGITAAREAAQGITPGGAESEIRLNLKPGFQQRPVTETIKDLVGRGTQVVGPTATALDAATAWAPKVLAGAAGAAVGYAPMDVRERDAIRGQDPGLLERWSKENVALRTAERAAEVIGPLAGMFVGPAAAGAQIRQGARALKAGERIMLAGQKAPKPAKFLSAQRGKFFRAPETVSPAMALGAVAMEPTLAGIGAISKFAAKGRMAQHASGMEPGTAKVASGLVPTADDMQRAAEILGPTIRTGKRADVVGKLIAAGFGAGMAHGVWNSITNTIPHAYRTGDIPEMVAGSIEAVGHGYFAGKMAQHALGRGAHSAKAQREGIERFIASEEERARAIPAAVGFEEIRMDPEARLGISGFRGDIPELATGVREVRGRALEPERVVRVGPRRTRLGPSGLAEETTDSAIAARAKDDFDAFMGKIRSDSKIGVKFPEKLQIDGKMVDRSGNRITQEELDAFGEKYGPEYKALMEESLRLQRELQDFQRPDLEARAAGEEARELREQKNAQRRHEIEERQEEIDRFFSKGLPSERNRIDLALEEARGLAAEEAREQAAATSRAEEFLGPEVSRGIEEAVQEAVGGVPGPPRLGGPEAAEARALEARTLRQSLMAPEARPGDLIGPVQEGIVQPAGAGRERVDMEALRALAEPPPTSVPPEAPEPPGRRVAAEPVEAERREGERRVEAAERKRVAEMTPEEMRAALLQDDLTGLGNDRAWKEVQAEVEGPESARRVVAVDLARFKALNDRIGHENADLVLTEVGGVIRDLVGPEQGFRPHGDEFLFVAEAGREKALEAEFVKRAGAIRLRLDMEGEKSELVEGADVHTGTGRTYREADADLNRRAESARREARPEREARPAPPEGLPDLRGERAPGREREAPAPAEVAPPGPRAKPGPVPVEGIRVTFAKKPSAAVRKTMKAAGFVWDRKQKAYVGPENAKAEKLARRLEEKYAAKSDLPTIVGAKKRAPAREREVLTEPPKDEQGNRILEGQEGWSPEKRGLVHETADAMVAGIAQDQKMDPTGRYVVSEYSRGGEGPSRFVKRYGIPSHKKGTPLEDIDASPKQMAAALKRDKGNELEREIHEAVEKDPRVEDAVEAQRAKAETAPPRLFGLIQQTAAGEQRLIPGALGFQRPTRTEGREGEGPLFTQAEDTRIRAEERSQMTLGEGVPRETVPEGQERYPVKAVTPEELAKAEKDPDYFPREETVGYIDAATERAALASLETRKGEFPEGAELGGVTRFAVAGTKGVLTDPDFNAYEKAEALKDLIRDAEVVARDPQREAPLLEARPEDYGVKSSEAFKRAWKNSERLDETKPSTWLVSPAQKAKAGRLGKVLDRDPENSEASEQYSALFDLAEQAIEPSHALIFREIGTAAARYVQETKAQVARLEGRPRFAVAPGAETVEGINARMEELLRGPGKRSPATEAQLLRLRDQRDDLQKRERLAAAVRDYVGPGGDATALGYVPAVRESLRDVLPGKEFDEYLLKLNAEGVIQLQEHPTPAQLTEAERAAMIPGSPVVPGQATRLDPAPSVRGKTRYMMAVGYRSGQAPTRFAVAEKAPPFFSHLRNVVDKIKQKAGSASDFLRYLKDPKRGVKAEELRWTGLEEWLKERKGKVSKEEMQRFLDENDVQIQETVKADVKADASELRALDQLLERTREAEREWSAVRGDISQLDDANIRLSRETEASGRLLESGTPEQIAAAQRYWDAVDAYAEKANRLEAIRTEGKATATKFGQWQLPGAKEGSYRELLLTLGQKPGEQARLKGLEQELRQVETDLAGLRGQRQRFLDEGGETERFPGKQEHTEKLARATDIRQQLIRGEVWTAPEPLTTLPAGYELIRDQNQPPDKRWGITPPGQVHARAFEGWHPTKEAASAAALRKVNSAREWKAREEWDKARQEKEYTAGHWDEPNVLAHVRFNERVGPNGERVLFVEEVQSDWHQTGKREGYGPRTPDEQYFLRMPDAEIGRDFASRAEGERFLAEHPNAGTLDRAVGQATGVPPAPFAGATKSPWHEMAMRRMVRYASENGFDKLSWISGEETAKRYDLSKQIDTLRWSTTKEMGETRYTLTAMKEDPTLGPSTVLRKENLTATELEAHVGKDVAARVLEGRGRTKTDAEGREYGALKGLDLAIGGEWAKNLYDVMLPSAMKRFGKQWGAEVERAGDEWVDRSGDFGTYPTKAGASEYVRRNEGGDWDADGNQRFRYLKRGDGEWGIEERVAAEAFQSMDITPAMRESVVAKGVPKFAISDAEYAEGQKRTYEQWKRQLKEKKATFRKLAPLGIANVKRAFPGSKIRKEKGGFVVTMPNGTRLLVDPAEASIAMPLDPAAFQRAYGRPKDTQFALGSFQRTARREHVPWDGIVQLSGNAPAGTALHESFHAAMALALSEKQRAAILKRHGAEEKAAEAYAEWTPKTRHGIFQQIRAFFERIYRAFRPTAESAFEAVRTGKAWRARGAEGARGPPRFAAAPLPKPEAPTGPIPEPLAEGRATGRPPRVEARVETLRKAEKQASALPYRLAREDRQKWVDLDSDIRELVATKEDSWFYNVMKRRRLTAPEVQAWDMRVRGKAEAMGDGLSALREARQTGEGADAASRDYLASQLDFIRAQRESINDGSGAGRALAARARIMKGVRTIDDTFIRKMLKELDVTDVQAAELVRVWHEKPEFLPQFLQQAIRRKPLDKILELYKANLLSAFSTDIANMTGNAVEHHTRVVETALASGVDWGISALRGSERERFLGEVAGEVGGTVKALGPALRQFGHDMRDVFTLKDKPIDPTGARFEHQIGAIGTGPRATRAEKVAGKVARTSFGKLEAEDMLWQALGGGAELGKLARRKAETELRGRTKAEIGERAAEIEREVLDGDNIDHIEIIRDVAAAKEARTFRDKPWDAIQSLINISRRHPSLQAVFPFIKTPGNLARLAVQRSPAGFVRAAKVYQKFLKGEASQGELSDAIARPLLGTTILAAFATYAMQGGMTGGGPTDWKQKSLLRDTGWQPYSFVFEDEDGKKHYIPFNRFDPISAVLGFAADVAEMRDRKDAGDMFDKALASITENLTSKTYLKGLGDASALISDPRMYASRYVSGMVGGFLVPNIVARGARAIDPVVRETKPTETGFGGIPEKVGKVLMSRIPGVSQRLAPRVSATGAPVERVGAAVSRFAFPVQESVEREGREVEKLLLDIGYTPSAPSRMVTIPGTGGERVRLGDREYAYLVRAREQATDRVRRALRSPGFRRLDPEEQRRRIESLFSRASSDARRRLMPRLRRRLRRAS